MIQKPLLRPDEVADLLNVSRATVYRWLDCRLIVKG